MSDLDYFFANKVPSTLRRGNLRMEFYSENASNVFCSYNNHRCQVSLCAPSRVSFQKFLKFFSIHTKTKPAISKSSGLKNVFEKLRFRSGLVWTVSLTVELKLCFHNVDRT